MLENKSSSFSFPLYVYVVIVVYLLKSLLGRCHTIYQIYEASIVSDLNISNAIS